MSNPLLGAVDLVGEPAVDANQFDTCGVVRSNLGKQWMGEGNLVVGESQDSCIGGHPYTAPHCRRLQPFDAGQEVNGWGCRERRDDGESPNGSREIIDMLTEQIGSGWRHEINPGQFARPSGGYHPPCELEGVERIPI